MSIPVIRFPLDITGLNPDNFVNGEIHTLNNKPVRAIAPIYGAFFTESLKVFDNRTQQLLVRGTQYICTELLQTATETYGKEICYLILIIDPGVSPDVVIQYQVLGGLYTNSGDAIIKIYEAITKDERPVSWINVLDKPIGFPPTQHLHDGRDIYGLEYVVTALERIRSAIIISDVPAYENMMEWTSNELNSIRSTITNKENLVEDEYLRAKSVEDTLRLAILNEAEKIETLRNEYLAANVLLLNEAKNDTNSKIVAAGGATLDSIKATLISDPTATTDTYFSGDGSWKYISAPTKTGLYATGTWDINILGNAKTATSAGTLTIERTINGVAFNGSKNITITATADDVYPWAKAVSTPVTSVNILATLVGQNISCASLTATGDVTAYSDERLKTNWRPVSPNFAKEWANIKYGVYERIDTKEVQAGLSAQSVQKILPEVVIEQPNGVLTLNYGAAAAVASVNLAQEIVKQNMTIEKLLSIVNSLEDRIKAIESK